MSEITDGSLMVVGGDENRRRRGRPRAETQGVRVSTWLPAEEFDKLCRLAFKYDMTVSAVLRFKVTRTK